MAGYEQLEGRIVAALDTETSDVLKAGRRVSVPVSFQILWTEGTPITEADLGSCPSWLLRRQDQIPPVLAKIVNHGIKNKYVPVIAIHNLAFDLRFLMDYLQLAEDNAFEIECCFKSSIKPLNVSITKNRKKVLVFWDTLSFSGMSLAKMGHQCGREKLLGSWDYSKARTPETPLTPEEKAYAMGDCETLLSWLAYWIGLNPEVDPARLGISILTKTSVVRYKTRKISEALPVIPRKGKRSNAFADYLLTCQRELPADNLAYNLMIRATSAGWAFTAARAAGVDFGRAQKYDATSMHPSHMISHYYPRSFEAVKNREMGAYLFSTICRQSVEKILAQWVNPFPYAFNARIAFRGLRLRKGSVFDRDGVALHGVGLFSNYETRFADYDDESSNREFNAINESGFANTAQGATYRFGKLVKADLCIIGLNEINAWVHAQVYEWDSFEVLAMTATATKRRPPDHVYISVREMLSRKKFTKELLSGVKHTRPEWMPESAYADIREDPKSEASSLYYGLVKADLNSLYGMFATNEAKQDIDYIEGENTFDYSGPRGFEKLPKKPKAWYNFGMRVAAYSRLQQCIAMLLLDKAGVVESFINGDTDSLAFQGVPGADEEFSLLALEPLHDAIDRAREFCIPARYNDSGLFSGLGLYETDCRPSHYCAVANKRYAYMEDERLTVHCAGVPTSSIEKAFQFEAGRGESFAKCTLLTLGYNVTYVRALSGTKARVIPEWGERLDTDVIATDYLRNSYIYPPETCTGISLVETDKALGFDYQTDYFACCDNMGVVPVGPHSYGVALDVNDKEIIGRW